MTGVPAIEVHDLTVAYQHKPVLWNVDFSIPEHTITAVVGPNGAGKSTLLKAILNLVPLASGYVKIFGQPVEDKRSLLAYVPQREDVDWDFPIDVLGVVLMGRYSHRGPFSRLTKSDHEIARESLEQVGLSDLIHRQISQLSGGQQQRVFIARALAQRATIYLMDEPLAGVDAATERTIIDIFQALKREGKSVICVHHDLNTVSDYYDHAILVNQRLIACGPTSEVITPENLNKTYGGRLGVLAEVAERLRARGWEKRTER